MPGQERVINEFGYDLRHLRHLVKLFVSPTEDFQGFIGRPVRPPLFEALVSKVVPYPFQVIFREEGLDLDV